MSKVFKNFVVSIRLVKKISLSRDNASTLRLSAYRFLRFRSSFSAWRYFSPIIFLRSRTCRVRAISRIREHVESDRGAIGTCEIVRLPLSWTALASEIPRVHVFVSSAIKVRTKSIVYHTHGNGDPARRVMECAREAVAIGRGSREMCRLIIITDAASRLARIREG